MRLRKLIKGEHCQYIRRDIKLPTGTSPYEAHSKLLEFERNEKNPNARWALVE